MSLLVGLEELDEALGVVGRLAEGRDPGVLDLGDCGVIWRVVAAAARGCGHGSYGAVPCRGCVRPPFCRWRGLVRRLGAGRPRPRGRLRRRDRAAAVLRAPGPGHLDPAVW